MWWLWICGAALKLEYSLMNRKLAPSSFRRASLNHDNSICLQGEQQGWLIDRWRHRLMPSMLTYPTSNDRNFLSSGWFFTKKVSTFRVKKDLSIASIFCSCKHDKIIRGTSPRALEDRRLLKPISKTRNKDHNNALACCRGQR